MRHFFLMAFGLVFIFEGLLPFLAPRIWRNAMQQMVTQNDRALRIFGLISMLLGLMLMYIFR